VEWVALDIEKVTWWGDVVGETTNGGLVTCHVVFLPLSNE